MNKRKISGKILLWLLLFTVQIILLSGALVGWRYYQIKMKEYNEAAFSYARTASTLIDGDRIPSYVETLEPDQYFDEIQAFFVASVEETNLKYYYVFVPYENDLVYIWDSDTEDGESPLGFREEYMEGGKEAVMKIYCQDPPEEIKITPDETYGYIASAFYPIFDSMGKPVAVVGVDLSMPNILKTIGSFISLLVFAVLIITALAAVVLYFAISKSIVQPLNRLNEAASEIVENLDRNKDFSVDIHTGDEIETLAGSFDRMHRDLKDYIEKNAAITAEKERITTELELAAKIQADMLPNVFPAFPDRKDFDIYAAMTPAKAVGGDFYDFFLIDEKHLGLVMADVSGKGIPAALFMMVSKNMLQNLAMTGMRPKDVLASVNEQICRSNREEMFVTVWFGVLDLTSGVLTAANAGHERPVIKQPGEDFAVYYDPHGFVIGGMEGLRYKEYELTLKPGATLFVFTDGVTEAIDYKEELFGIRRTVDALNAAGDASPQEYLDKVTEDIAAFVGDADPFDDLTMLCLTYNGNYD